MILERKELPKIVECLDQLARKELPIWHELSLNIKAVRNFYIKYQKDVDGIIEKYGTKKENGGVDWGNNAKKVEKEFEKMNSVSIDVEFVSIDIAKIKHLSLPAQIVEPLLDIIFNSTVVVSENSHEVLEVEGVNN